MGYDIETIFDIARDETEDYIRLENTSNRSLMLWDKLKQIEEEIKQEYILRMESDSFIMVINKDTGIYSNLYVEDFSKELLQRMVKILDKHESMEG